MTLVAWFWCLDRRWVIVEIDKGGPGTVWETWTKEHAEGIFGKTFN